jgi:hypothetical protein
MCPMRPYIRLLTFRERIEGLTRIDNGARTGRGRASGREIRCWSA